MRDFNEADKKKKKARIEIPDNPEGLSPDKLAELEESVKSALKEGYLACPVAWSVAKKAGVPKIAVGSIIDKLGVQKESGVKLSIIQKVAEELGFITGRKTIKLEQLVDNIYNEIPQIIAIKKKEKDYHHFVIPVGTYDKGIIVRDPAKIEYGYIPLEEFKQRCYGNDGKFLSLSLKLDKNPEYSNNGASRS